mmetsp:Transcript_24262/g.75844  ORF Transcript_24262/g.75844 Transcript_24262/m.75844 type:complete len:82 (+) Transcript_24262:137-382(+)
MGRRRGCERASPIGRVFGYVLDEKTDEVLTRLGDEADNEQSQCQVIRSMPDVSNPCHQLLMAIDMHAPLKTLLGPRRQGRQ